MSFSGFVFLFFFFIVALVAWAFVSAKNEQEKVNAMSPADRANYLFGPINNHLICPHCQTKGLVHAMKATRVSTSTGKVGGILKTNTESTTTRVVTQHHCEQCGTTWDV